MAAEVFLRVGCVSALQERAAEVNAPEADASAGSRRTCQLCMARMAACTGPETKRFGSAVCEDAAGLTRLPSVGTRGMR